MYTAQAASIITKTLRDAHPYTTPETKARIDKYTSEVLAGKEPNEDLLNILSRTLSELKESPELNKEEGKPTNKQALLKIIDELASSIEIIGQLRNNNKKVTPQSTVDLYLDAYSRIASEATLKLNESLESHRSRLEQQLQESNKHIQENQSKIEEKRREIEEILGAISTKSITNGHHSRADIEERSANQMRWGGIACMALSSAIMIWLIWEMSHSSSELTGSQIAARIAISLILSIPAAYLTRESAKHRQQHYRHRAAALDLATIDPFLASMPEDKRNELKLEIAKRLFAQNETPAQNDPYPINVQEILMALVQRANTETPKEAKKESK